MLCQRCGLSEATVHRENIVYRQKIEEHLCQPCAGTGSSFISSALYAQVLKELSTGSTKSAQQIPYDPQRPKELRLPHKILVRILAKELHIEPFRAISILMGFGLFCSMQTELEFSKAARLCKYCGVSALPSDEKTA